MQNEQLIRNAEPAVKIEICPARNISPCPRLTEARTPRQPIRIPVPARRGESCLTRRALLAALREAEFADWQATGGDFLNSMRQAFA
jgi:hypothetical protein